MCRVHPGSTRFEDMKRSWSAAEDWCYERPGKTFDEGAASVAVEGPRLKGSCKELVL